MDLKITLYTIIYGLPKAFRASKKTKRSFFSIYKEMVSLSSKYDVQLFEYMDHAIYKLNDIEREAAIHIAKEKHEYAKLYDANMRFLVKYSKFEHQKSLKSRHKRREAYIKFYHMGKNCHIQYGVTFIFEHRRIGKLQIGSNCLFARNVDIDTTGDLTIGDFHEFNSKLGEFNDGNGLSLIIINSEKGNQLFNIIKKNFSFQ